MAQQSLGTCVVCHRYTPIALHGLCRDCVTTTRADGTYALYKPDRRAYTPCAAAHCRRKPSGSSVLCHRHNQLQALGADLDTDYSRRRDRCDNEHCDNMGHLELDHDHLCCAAYARTRCGKCNRGYLCRHCNTLLGRIEVGQPYFDLTARITGLLAYVERYRERRIALDALEGL